MKNIAFLRIKPRLHKTGALLAAFYVALLGNQTSQWFALYYLDPMDRIIKEKMHIKYYVRYMDDGILIHESKEVLNRTRRQAEAPSS